MNKMESNILNELDRDVRIIDEVCDVAISGINREKYLEDNMDMIFGTECIFVPLNVKFRERLEKC